MTPMKPQKKLILEIDELHRLASSLGLSLVACTPGAVYVFKTDQGKSLQFGPDEWEFVKKISGARTPRDSHGHL